MVDEVEQTDTPETTGAPEKSASAPAETTKQAPAAASVPASESVATGETPADGTVNERMKWYAVLTNSAMEKKAKVALEERIRKQDLGNLFGQVIIPSQQVDYVDEYGKRKKREQKMMPGYLFVQMDMTPESFACVRGTPKITNFLGASLTRMPPPMGDDEVERVLNRAAHMAKAQMLAPKRNFDKGERVRVTDGPFTGFMGEVDEVRTEKQKLRVLISVFGRPTPVEIEFNKVEKVREES